MSEQLRRHTIPESFQSDFDNLSPDHALELARAIGVISVLDPGLLEFPDAKPLIVLGGGFGAEVTSHYGTPHQPVWASGACESEVIMSYHNGGADGHTSVGPNGCGVPRNVLLLAKAVNKAARQEVFSPLARATSFYSAYAHDRYQLCGRSLLPEGQGEGRGDERMSAEVAASRYLELGGDPLVAEQSYSNVMATAFNPYTNVQNVNYEFWDIDPTDPRVVEAVLGQELTAAADLLGPIQAGGPLGSIQHTVEFMCLNQKDRIIQQRLYARGIEPLTITDLGRLFDVIDQDKVLRDVFLESMARQSTFFFNTA